MMWLEILKVGDYDCLGLENLDATDQEWVEYGTEGLNKPIHPAVLVIPSIDTPIALTVQIADSYRYTDAYVYVNTFDENGEYLDSFSDYISNVENGLIVLEDIFSLVETTSKNLSIWADYQDYGTGERHKYWIDVIVATEVQSQIQAQSDICKY